MDFTTKYSIGEHVLVKADKKIKVPCPFCDGKGYRIVNFERLYCQNCEDGELIQRSCERCFVEGVITGFFYEQKNRKDVDEDYLEDFNKVTDEDVTLIEYYVDVPDDYYGNGTYNEDTIKKL